MNEQRFVSPAARLRHRLSRDDILVAPGVFDAWSARLTERAGFESIYMTGFGTAASLLGVPDLGLVTATEMADHASRLSQAVAVPVIADADTGFGDLLNVQRTMRLYERAGVGAIQLEDQISPKRCGHMEDKQVVPASEMVRRIRAAREACSDPDMVIIARTDARATDGLDEALRRGEQYLAAGADMLFVEAPQSDAELQAVCDAFRGEWLLANVVEAGKTPYHAADELQAMGFRLAIFPISSLLAATRAVAEGLREIREHGRLTGETAYVDFGTFNQLMGLEDYIRAARDLAGHDQ